MITQIFKKNFIVGLDIGVSSIKIAQFIKKEDGLYLVKAVLKEIKPSDDNALHGQEIIFALKDLFKGIDLKKSKIIAVINCPKTAVRIARAPYMPKKELRNGINLEAKNYFPFPTGDSLLDYEILGEVVEEGIRKYEVAIALSPKITVEKYVSLLEKAGIKPASFIPFPNALQRVAERLCSKEGEILCFLDIGGLHTELAIFKGTALLFSRKIPVAGSDFTKSMTGVLISDRGKIGLSSDEAEKIKRELGVPPEGESKIIDDKIYTTQILSMLRAPLGQLVSEIERCFDYYREESGAGKIDSLTLFGGGASLGGLIKYLSGQLGIDVKLGDSLEGLKVQPGAINAGDKISYRLESAIGAAQSEGKGINLLPPEMKEEAKRTVKLGRLEVIVIAVILISVSVYIGIKIQLNNFQRRIAVAEREFKSLQPQLKDVQAQILSDRILANEPYWEDILKELSNIIPDNVYLTELAMKNKVIKMKGIATTEERGALLSKFILMLEEGIFSKVKLVASKELEDKLANKFELTCWVD